MLSSLILAINKKVTNWILSRISPENFKPFNTNFDQPMSNLANGGVILKFNHSVLVENVFFFIV